MMTRTVCICIEVLFLSFLIHGGQGTESHLPHFKWIACKDVEDVAADNADACMSVAFADGETDTIVLNTFMGEDNVFGGHFLKESTASVAVSGGNMATPSAILSISFESIHSPNCGLFYVNVQEGTKECVEVEHNSDIVVPSKHVVTNPAPRSIHEARALNPKGYKMKVVVRYDNGFKEMFKEDPKAKIAQIMTHVSNFYALPSLTTKIQLNIIKVEHVDKDLTPSNAQLFEVQDLTGYGDIKDADAYVYLCSKTNTYTEGISWFQTTCGTFSRRVSIVKYLRSDLVTAANVAHEIGHNLGMLHDFENGNRKEPRYASDKSNCTFVGGIMDYNGVSRKWTKCSVEDFTEYHDSVKPFCLEAITDSGTPNPPVKTTTKKPPVKTTTKKPPVKTTTKKPPVKTTTKKPPVKTTTKKPPVSTTKKPTEETTTSGWIATTLNPAGEATTSGWIPDDTWY